MGSAPAGDTASAAALPPCMFRLAGPRLSDAQPQRGGADRCGEVAGWFDEVAVELPRLFPVAADLHVSGLEGFHYRGGGPVADERPGQEQPAAPSGGH